MFCSNCGNQLPDWAMFCNICGTPVARLDAAGSEEPEIKESLAPSPLPPIVESAALGSQAETKSSPPIMLYPPVMTETVIPKPQLPSAQEVFPDVEETAEPAGTLAIGAFVLGLMSLLFFFVGAAPGIPAVIMGLLELKRIRAQSSAETGRHLALLGIVMGIIGSAFFSVVMILVAGDPLV